MRPKLVIGLTGGIASGKTAVSGCFERLGVPVIDADVVAREVVEPGEPLVDAIVREFGDRVLGPDGRLDRGLLREIAFGDEGKRRRLESLLHPEIRRRMSEQLDRAGHEYALMVIPLLLEAGQVGLVDRVLVVDAPESLQISRARERDGGSPEDIRRIMSAQLSRQQRLERADDVIDNSGSLDALREQVGKLDQFYRTIADSVAAKGR